jgi:hypothetical protein
MQDQADPAAAAALDAGLDVAAAFLIDAHGR